MKTLFFANDNYEKEITRSRAKGYKKLVIDENVEVAKPVEVKTETCADGTNIIRIVSAPKQEKEKKENYIFLTKEIGSIYGELTDTEVEIICLDNGWLLVTLKRGAIAVMLNDKLVVPTVDYKLNAQASENNIKWVTADDILSASNSYGKIQHNYIENMLYDFIFVMNMASLAGPDGQRIYVGIHYKFVDVLDISLGAFALFKQRKEELEKTRKPLHTFNPAPKKTKKQLEKEKYEEDAVKDEDVDIADLDEFMDDET